MDKSTDKRMNVHIVDDNAQLPLRANTTDAGADLFSPVDTSIKAGTAKFIDFGIQIELPKDTVGLIFARSGLGSKGIRPRNAVGVIDEKYRGNLGVMLENVGTSSFEIKKGDRIAQMVVVPIIKPSFFPVTELDMEGDRQGGFGSTGK